MVFYRRAAPDRGKPLLWGGFYRRLINTDIEANLFFFLNLNDPPLMDCDFNGSKFEVSHRFKNLLKTLIVQRVGAGILGR